MTIIGIDLGSHNIKVAAVHKGAVHIVSNSLSERVFPSLTTHKANERLIGELAMLQKGRNANASVWGHVNLLGMEAESREATVEQQHLLSKLHKSQEFGTLDIHMEDGSGVRVSILEAVSALFGHIKVIAEKQLDCAVSGAVIAVPPWYGDTQRAALMQASMVANMPSKQIVESCTAVGLQYGWYRSSNFEEKHYVMFVDIGHSATCVFVIEFKQQEARVVSTACNRNLGGRDVEFAIAGHLMEQIKAQYPSLDIDSAWKKPRYRTRIMESANRVKHILTANRNASVTVECAYEDNDMTLIVERSDIEQLCVFFSEGVSDAITQCLSGLDSTNVLIKAVELIGGTSRIPLVPHAVSRVIDAPLMRTLDSDECIARGCALRAAMIDQTKRLRVYHVPDTNRSNIYAHFEGPVEPQSIKISFEEGLEGRNVETSVEHNKLVAQVFAADSPLPAVARLRFNMHKGTVVINFTSINKWHGKGQVICTAQLSVDAPQLVEFGIGLSNLGLLYLTKAFIITMEEKPNTVECNGSQVASHDENNQDESVESKETDMENLDETLAAEAQVALTPVFVEVKRPLQFTHKYSPTYMSTESIQVLREREMAMVNRERRVRLHLDAKNELESTIYDLRKHIEDSWRPFATDQESRHISVAAASAETWLCEEADKANVDEINKYMKNLLEMAQPLKNRKQQYDARNILIPTLQEKIATIEKQISESNGEKHTQLVQEILNHIAELNNMIKIAQSMPLSCDPSLTCSQLNNAMSNIVALADQFNNLAANEETDAQSTPEMPGQEPFETVQS